jgi:hypothetical protein
MLLEKVATIQPSGFESKKMAEKRLFWPKRKRLDDYKKSLTMMNKNERNSIRERKKIR